jgi:predicted transcriptional regulator
MPNKKKIISSAISGSFVRRSSVCDEDKSDDDFSHAPYDNPSHKKNSLRKLGVNKHKDKPAFIELSELQQKVLVALLSYKGKDGNTRPIRINQFSQEIGVPVSSLKKTIQRLELLGFIIREQYKQGRGGWTIYSIKESDSLKSNWSQTGVKLESN